MRPFCATTACSSSTTRAGATGTTQAGSTQIRTEGADMQYDRIVEPAGKVGTGENQAGKKKPCRSRAFETTLVSLGLGLRLGFRLRLGLGLGLGLRLRL